MLICNQELSMNNDSDHHNGKWTRPVSDTTLRTQPRERDPHALIARTPLASTHPGKVS